LQREVEKNELATFAAAHHSVEGRKRVEQVQREGRDAVDFGIGNVRVTVDDRERFA